MAFYKSGTEYHFGLYIFIDFIQIYVILSEELKASRHINVLPQKM